MSEIKGARASMVIIDEVFPPAFPFLHTFRVPGLRAIELVATCMRDMGQAAFAYVPMDVYQKLCRDAETLFQKGLGPIRFLPVEEIKDTLIVEVEGLRRMLEFASAEEAVQRGHAWAVRPSVEEVDRVIKLIRGYPGPVRLVPKHLSMASESTRDFADRIKKRMEEAMKGKVFTPVQALPPPPPAMTAPFVPWTEEEMRNRILTHIQCQVARAGNDVRQYHGARQEIAEHELSNWQRLLAYAKEKLK